MEIPLLLVFIYLVIGGLIAASLVSYCDPGDPTHCAVVGIMVTLWPVLAVSLAVFLAFRVFGYLVVKVFGIDR